VLSFSRRFASCASQCVPLIVSNHLHPHLQSWPFDWFFSNRTPRSYFANAKKKNERRSHDNFSCAPQENAVHEQSSHPSISDSLTLLFLFLLSVPSSRRITLVFPSPGILSSNAQARNDCFAVKTMECASKGDAVTRLIIHMSFILFLSLPFFSCKIMVPSSLQCQHPALRIRQRLPGLFSRLGWITSLRKQPAGILLLLSRERSSLFIKNHSYPLANVITFFSQAFQVLGDANPM